jgi:multidrug resistance efflux pump
MLKHFRSITTAIAALLGVAGIVLVLHAWGLPPFAGTDEVTDNAYVRGQVTILSPQITGYVAEVAVKDFEKVKAGQFLARIDDRIYRQKVKQAEAALHAQQAQIDALAQKRLSAEAKLRASKSQIEGAQTVLNTAQASFERSHSLFMSGMISQSALDQARSTLENARSAVVQAKANDEIARQDLDSVAVSREGYVAAIDSAKAALELANIDLKNTRIIAPVDGSLGEVGMRIGQLVTAGSQLMAVVPERIWVTANFKETQLHGMGIGQAVTFTVDALDHRRFTGRIESLSPAAGSEFSVLKPDNATGNFTKVSQRLSVRIAIDPDQEGKELLAPGMSAVVRVNAGSGGPREARAQRDSRQGKPDWRPTSLHG